MTRVLDGVSDLMMSVLEKALLLLGIYASYKLVFEVNVPLVFLFVVSLVIFAVSWFLAQEEEKIKAIPIVQIPAKKAKPTKAVKIEGNL